MGITYYVRGEFYREKAKDYVGAAISMGASDAAIIFKHILPNSLTPVISFAPFMIVGNISALVALDFLGFGLPAPTPSWGELIEQGTAQSDQLVAGLLSAGGDVRDPAADCLHRRSRARSLRSQRIFEAAVSNDTKSPARCCRSAT